MSRIDRTIEEAQRALAAGDIATVEQLCQAAMKLASRDPRPWALLAETALRRNRPDAAIGCADRAVALAPDDALGHVMRAKCLLSQGDQRGALAAAEAGAKARRKSPGALDGLGATFGLLGRHAQALPIFERIAAAHPGNPQFLFNLAATERVLGRLERAETHCDAAIRAERHYYLAHYLRADLRTQSAERNHVAEMEALIEGSVRYWQGEVMLRYALGKECEDLGDDARAFRHVAAGAALQRKRTSYDVATDIAPIDRLIATQTKPWLAGAPPGYAEAAPIFVAGLPRSGTTLVERIIASHGDVGSVGETGLFAVELARATRAGGPPDPVSLGRSYVETVTAVAAPPAPRFLDKTLQNYLHCGFIHAALPRAKIILLRRDPMDSCFALYKAHFQDRFAFSYDLEELAAYYAAFHRLAEHWRRVLPADAFMEIAYEDIVGDQEAASRRLLAFLDLPWQDEVLRFHESRTPSATASAVQVRRPIYASSVGRWRRHEAALAPLQARLRALLPFGDMR